jgi:YidC/Oxa1 family membrane protein insertase
MIVIKRYFIDSDKIHAQIQENKLKEPKKQGKFRKTSRVMEQAEAQKHSKRKVIPIQALRNESFFFT